MSRKTIFSLILLLAALPATHALAQPSLQLAAFEEIALAAPPDRPSWTATIAASGGEWPLHLKDDEAFVAAMTAATRAALRRPDWRWVRGEVAGSAGSWVRLAWYGGAWHGGFYDGESLYLIDPPEALSGLLPRLPEPGARALLYRFDDVLWPPLFDIAPLPPAAGDGGRIAFTDFAAHLKILGAGDFVQLPVTLVSDTEFSAIHGTNSAAVAASRVFFIDGIYSEQVGVAIGLHHHETLAVNGPLLATDPGDLLNQFRLFMTSGAGASIPRFQNRANAHLFTGKDLNGGVVGIAFLSVLCSQNAGFGVDQNLNNATTAALVFAHELGHNFGAPHDREPGSACENSNIAGIMNPSINGSQQFSTCSIDQMQDDIAGATCLAVLPEVIFGDGFED